MMVSTSTAQGCPQLLGRWPHGPAGAVAIEGTTAYVGAGATLVVVDVTNLATPVQLGFVGNGRFPPGLRVMDLSIPSAPAELNTASTLGTPQEVFLSGWRAYSPEVSHGLVIYDLTTPTTPTTPVHLGMIDTPGEARDVVVVGANGWRR